MITNIVVFVAVNVLIAFAAFQFGRSWSTRSKRTAMDNGVTTSTIFSSKDPTLQCRLTVLEHHSLQDALAYFHMHAEDTPSSSRLLELYQVERSFPDLSHFRLGPNMFEKIDLDWIILSDVHTGQLIGHGITTRIAWEQKIEDLPSGWQGVVRTSYYQSHVENRPKNTLVGLFIFVEDEFRQHGWANNVIEEMRSLAVRQHLQALIIPLRPPLRYTKEYAAMPMTEFAQLKREDGHPLDHWIRLHTRLGAKILCASEKSHQHAMSVEDFRQQFSPVLPENSGYTLVERNGQWYQVYVDLEHDFVLINQGCVWVRHEF